MEYNYLTNQLNEALDHASIDDDLSYVDIQDLEKKMKELTLTEPDIFFEYLVECPDNGWEGAMTNSWVCKGQIVTDGPQIIWAKYTPKKLLAAVDAIKAQQPKVAAPEF